MTETIRVQNLLLFAAVVCTSIGVACMMVELSRYGWTIRPAAAAGS
jgi:hypothetical protein